MGLPGSSVGKESACNAGDCLPVQETRVQSLVGKIPGRRKWQPNPVFLPGEFLGQRSLAGYNPWGHKESDASEQVTQYKDLLKRILNADIL